MARNPNSRSQQLRTRRRTRRMRSQQRVADVSNVNGAVLVIEQATEAADEVAQQAVSNAVTQVSEVSVGREEYELQLEQQQATIQGLSDAIDQINAEEP